MNSPDLRSFTLRDFPGPTRGLIAVFLIAIGCGYFAGLVQLHHQHAKPGNLLPTADDAVDIYHGPTERQTSKLERVVAANEGPFTGHGSMKPAFFEKSAGWKGDLGKRDEAGKQKLMQEREGERQALLEWIRAGGPKGAYDKNHFLLEKPLVLTDDFIVKDENGKILKDDQGMIAFQVKTLLQERCERCHADNDFDAGAARFPLDSHEKLRPYLAVKSADPMDIKKLAQTTHVHLIGFTMMFFLTGLIFSFTSYPGWVRAILAPWPMFFQVCDISCWWLGRYQPLAAQAILVTGALVGIGFGIHILGGLLDVTGIAGRRKVA